MVKFILSQRFQDHLISTLCDKVSYVIVKSISCDAKNETFEMKLMPQYPRSFMPHQLWHLIIHKYHIEWLFSFNALPHHIYSFKPIAGFLVYMPHTSHEICHHPTYHLGVINN